MCGIAGALDFESGAPEAALLERMARMVHHRGPDGHGVWRKGPIGLAHTRLSIVDLAGGAQPMRTADGRFAISFNGEIFNHVELREELEQKGYRFETDHSDTEVILHAYAEWGDDCFTRFNGQWSIALWDDAEQRLVLSRDRLGIRPLYYSKLGTRWLFGSEVKSLFCHPGMPRRLNHYALTDILTFWAPMPGETVFDDVSELKPGHCIAIDASGSETWSFWNLNYSPEPGRKDSEWAEELRALLIDATRLRLRADVPVGAYLSGGIDSSVNAAIIKRFTDAKLRTFSVTFAEKEFDESTFQEDVISLLETDHSKIHCHNSDIGRVFPEVIWHTERPVVRTAPAPFFLLSNLVRDSGYKVVLTGEGADEILGGYDIFKEAKIRRFWGRHLDSKMRPLLLRRLYPYMQSLQSQSPAYLQAFFHVTADSLQHPFFSHLPRWELTRKTHLFLSPEIREAVKKRDAYAELEARLPARFFDWGPFEQAQYLEATILMPGYILSSQGDRMSMAHGVEGRFPFLDHRVAELAGRMPATVKMKVLDEKHVLKAATRDLIPSSVLKRPKQPYRAPDAVSFFPKNGAPPEYVRALLDPIQVRKAGIFNEKAVSRLLDKAAKGQVLGIKDNMSLVGILSTQILISQFIHDFDAHSST